MKCQLQPHTLSMDTLYLKISCSTHIVLAITKAFASDDTFNVHMQFWNSEQASIHTHMPVFPWLVQAHPKYHVQQWLFFGKL